MLEVASSHASPHPSSMQVASGDSLFSSPSSSTAIRTHLIAAPMASPIWEEGPSTPYDDDDVPLSFSLSPSLSSSNASSSRYGGSGAGVRRSHTVTAAGSRLHRISSSGSGGSSSSAHPSSSTSASSIIDRPLSASTGVSRRTSLKAGAGAGSGLNRVVELEGSAEIEEDSHQPVAYQELYPSNAYIPGDDDHDEDEALYPSAAASLARHSSMPVSRAFRRKDPSNPGAPWQRNHYNNAHTSPATDNSSTHVELHHRTRSNSTAAEVGSRTLKRTRSSRIPFDLSCSSSFPSLCIRCYLSPLLFLLLNILFMLSSVAPSITLPLHFTRLFLRTSHSMRSNAYHIALLILHRLVFLMA